MLKKRTEEITENGVVYIVETYTNSKGEVKGKTKYPKPTGTPSEPEAPQPTQLDRIEEQVNAIANGTTAENTEAINALLGG